MVLSRAKRHSTQFCSLSYLAISVGFWSTTMLALTMTLPHVLIVLLMPAARKCGMTSHAICTQAESLQFMKYTMKTVYRISEDNYHGTALSPLVGTGHGSGASPAVWLSLVVILLQTLDRLIPDRLNFSSLYGFPLSRHKNTEHLRTCMNTQDHVLQERTY